MHHKSLSRAENNGYRLPELALLLAASLIVTAPRVLIKRRRNSRAYVRFSATSGTKSDMPPGPTRADCVAKVRKRLVSIFSPDGKASRDRLLV